MVRLEACQLQPEVGLYRGRDVRWPGRINTPAAICVLVIENVTRRLLEPLRRARTEQGVQQDVVGFEGSVGFEFATPVALIVLLREEEFAGGI